MGRIRCFMLEPAPFAREALRRFVFTNDDDGNPVPAHKCPGCPFRGIHDATVILGQIPLALSEHEGRMDDHPHDDPRWPRKCDRCDFVFEERSRWQHVVERLFRRSDNGELCTLRDAPVGAMYFADWMPKDMGGPDGRFLMVVCPGNHPWAVDGQANNCTIKTGPDAYPAHRCWVRHGTPPDITVDKNGKTCAAGAGSIVVPGWHGFLRNGYLEPC